MINENLYFLSVHLEQHILLHPVRTCFVYRYVHMNPFGCVNRKLTSHKNCKTHNNHNNKNHNNHNNKNKNRI